jgi:hypothetical protein
MIPKGVGLGWRVTEGSPVLGMGSKGPVGLSYAPAGCMGSVEIPAV